MRRFILVSLVLAVLVANPASAQTLGAVLAGSQEVPSAGTQGFGFATVFIHPDDQTLTAVIAVANLGSPITGVRIHEAPAGINGDPVFDLQAAGGTFANNRFVANLPIAPGLAQRILQQPNEFYLNVTTTQFPDGAVRGQFSNVFGGAVKLAADLRASQETPPTGSDAFGSILMSFDVLNQTITWELQTRGMAPTLAHIHPGAAGAAGPPVIGFVTDPSAFTGGRAKGRITGVDAALMTSILADPSSFYFNVHSAAFPGGEIRGQLIRANESDIAVAGHVTNNRGETFVSDVRVFNPSYDAPLAALLELFPSGSTANQNAASSIVVDIPPRGTAILNDVAGSDDLDFSGTGAVRVSSAEPFAATSRVYTATEAGTFGQFVPGVAGDGGLRRGVMTQLALGAAFRTNVGFFNPRDERVSVRLELRGETGNLIAQSTLTLSPLTHQQAAIGTFFPQADILSAENLTLSFDAAAQVLGYASVVDNSSSDQIFVAAQPHGGLATTDD